MSSLTGVTRLWTELRYWHKFHAGEVYNGTPVVASVSGRSVAMPIHVPIRQATDITNEQMNG